MLQFTCLSADVIRRGGIAFCLRTAAMTRPVVRRESHGPVAAVSSAFNQINQLRAGNAPTLIGGWKPTLWGIDASCTRGNGGSIDR